MDDGPEPIADKEELRRVRAQARRVVLSAAGSALVATVLFLLPG